MLAGYIGLQAQNQKPVYLNPKAPIEERVKDALSRMTGKRTREGLNERIF